MDTAIFQAENKAGKIFKNKQAISKNTEHL